MIRLTRCITILVFVMVIAVADAHAQASRTWVSGVGDDVNPCSRTAPCKTFAGAISKTAAGGEIDALDPGGFGAVTITKAITIDGGNGNIAGVLVSGTNGIVVNAGSSDVVILRNLDINGLGTGLNGIRFLAGGALYVENSTIYGFTQAGIDFEPAGASYLSVDRTLVRNNDGGGILLKPGISGKASATITTSHFDINLFGVRAEDRSIATINNSVASGNFNNGFIAVSLTNPTEINMESCVSTLNAVNGVVAYGAGATIRLSNTLITLNGTGISPQSGGSVLSFGNNRNSANTTNGAPNGSLSQQ